MFDRRCLGKRNLLVSVCRSLDMADSKCIRACLNLRFVTVFLPSLVRILHYTIDQLLADDGKAAFGFRFGVTTCTLLQESDPGRIDAL